MHRTITARDYLSRLEAECRRDIETYALRDDGALFKRERITTLLPGPQACGLALKHAVASHLSGDEDSADFARACLKWARIGLVEWREQQFWAQEITPSLCNHGRWIRQVFYAARALNDDEAMGWAADFMVRWPYREGEGFVERVLSGPQAPTSLGGFSHTYNMRAEGAVDAWMLGHATQSATLMQRGEDELCNFILAGQRADGHWDYQARDESMSESDSCLPNEFNYSFYLTVILSNLLAFPHWRERIAPAVMRSFDALRASFERPDGSLAAPVHWGAGHIFESTLFSAIVAWRLQFHARQDKYAGVAARALHWKEQTPISGTVGLFWDRHLLEMMAEDFKVEGEVADTSQILDTLRDVERQISTPLASHMQFGRYYGGLPTAFAMQRRIQFLQDELENEAAPREVEVPPHPAQSAPSLLQWEHDANILNARALWSFDEQFLYARFEVVNDAHWQPYHGFELFRGDGVLLVFGDKETQTRLNLAVTQSGPVVFRYDGAHGFGGVRSWLPAGSSEGEVLRQSSLGVENDGATLIYEARLSWEELGLSPAQNREIPLSWTLTKLRPHGWQHHSWGRNPFDKDIARDAGVLRLQRHSRPPPEP